MHVVVHFPLFEQRVHRHHDSPRPQHAVVHDAERGHIGQHDPHPVTRLNAARSQHASDSTGRLVELGIREDVVVEADRGVVGIHGDGFGEGEREVWHRTIVALFGAAVHVGEDSRFRVWLWFGTTWIWQGRGRPCGLWLATSRRGATLFLATT